MLNRPTPDRRIFLVAVDGSVESVLAAERAFELASSERHDEIVLTAVLSKRSPTSVKIGDHELKLGRAANEDETKEERDALQKMLEYTRGCFVAKKFTGRVTLRVEEGEPKETILGLCKFLSVDYLIVGSRGLNKARALLGTTSNFLVSHAPCPVLVVRGEEVKNE